MEGGRKRKAIEQYSGYKSPNQRAEIGLADDADPSDGALYHFGVSRSLLGSNLSRETRPRSFLLLRHVLRLQTQSESGRKGSEDTTHGKNVRARNKHQKEHEHHARQFIAKSAPHQAHGIGVVLDMRMLQPDLADNIAGVDGNESDAHSHDYASHHA